MTEGFDPAAMLKTLLSSRNRLKFFPFVYIPEAYILELCSVVTNQLLAEDSILSVSPPLAIIGDTHGQFTDTVRILETCGDPSANCYLFLGDYVDRGTQSIENMVMLLTLKVLYPTTVFLLRGNHETEDISTVYGLRDECIRRYNFSLYSSFLRVFDAMPFGAIVAQKIFCVHGGISKQEFDINLLGAIQRPLDLTIASPVTDLLWSDPDPNSDGFHESARGVSETFGKKQARAFLKTNNLELIVRSHEFCSEGFSFPFGPDGEVVTVFSAANYCGTKNSSAVMIVGEDLIVHFKVFQVLENDKTETAIPA
jgi:serine/threonine-protein phosphatase PP1 catalytic subunit